MEEDGIKLRIRQLIKERAGTLTLFAKLIETNQSSLSRCLSNGNVVGEAMIDKIVIACGISKEWIKTGKGDKDRFAYMGKVQYTPESIHDNKDSEIQKYVSKIKDKLKEDVVVGTPFYDYLPASAGQNGLATIFKNETPTGYINIPGINAIAFFPVVGFSMEPEIRAGDHIGVKEVDNWDRLDTDKIYMIITGDDRMIKRMRPDNDDDKSLWCVSTNYKEFKILKSEIKAIYHVVYAGRFV